MITPFGAIAGQVVPAGFYPGDIPSWVGYDTVSEAPSVANLSRSLTINGTTVQPTAFYKASDASGTTWTAEVGGAAGLLTEAGSGASPTYSTRSPLMGGDVSVKYAGGANAKYHRAAGASFGDITTGDFVVETVFKFTSDNLTVFQKRINVTDQGWDVGTRSGSGIRMYVEDSSTNNAAIISATLTAGAWYHAICFCDRSGNGQWYINGVASGSAVSMASVGSITCAENFTIGATSLGAYQYSSNVSLVALWVGTATWLDTHLQATLAAQRFRALTGIRPQTSAAGVDTAPLTQARNCVATLEKYSDATGAVEYYTVGANWPRVERWKVGSTTVMGIRQELAAQNLNAYSTVMSGWTGTNATLAAANLIGYETAAAVTETVDNQYHRIYKNTVTFSNATKYVMSCYLKKGIRDVVALWVNSTAGSRWVNVNMATAAIGYSSGFDASGAINCGGGVVFAWGTWTHDETAARSGQIYSRSSNANSDPLNDIYVGSTAGAAFTANGFQIELGTYPSSLIATAASAVTRVKDELKYVAVHPGAQGAFCFDFASSTIPSATSTVLDLSDGGTTNRVRVNSNTSTGYIATTIGAGTDTVTSTANYNDAALHRIGVRWRSNQLELWVDGAMVGTPDVSFADIAALTQLAIGQNLNGAFQHASPCLQRNIRVYDYFPSDVKMRRLTTPKR